MKRILFFVALIAMTYPVLRAQGHNMLLSKLQNEIDSIKVKVKHTQEEIIEAKQRKREIVGEVQIKIKPIRDSIILINDEISRIKLLLGDSYLSYEETKYLHNPTLALNYYIQDTHSEEDEIIYENPIYPDKIRERAYFDIAFEARKVLDNNHSKDFISYETRKFITISSGRCTVKATRDEHPHITLVDGLKLHIFLDLVNEKNTEFKRLKEELIRFYHIKDELQRFAGDKLEGQIYKVDSEIYELTKKEQNLEYLLNLKNSQLNNFISKEISPTKYDSLLLEAVKSNNFKLVKKLIKMGANTNVSFGKNCTILINACFFADLKTVKYLINKGADYKAKARLYLGKGYFYGSLMTCVAGENKPEILEYFIEDLKIDINEIEDAGDGSETALHKACLMGAGESIKYLIAKGSNLYASDIYEAFNTDKFKSVWEKNKILKLLIQKIDNPDERCAYNGSTLLHFINIPEITALLIEKGADTNYKNEKGDIPLHTLIKAYAGKDSTIKHILQLHIDNKANVNALTSDYEAEAPVHLVLNPNITYGKDKKLLYNVFAFLIENNANSQIKDKNGDTPLHLALRHGFPEIAKLLIENNVDSQIKDKNGDTPLHLALRHGFPEIAKLLIENNAAIQLQDVEGKTALHLALEYGFPEIAKLLIENNAAIQLQDTKGNTALHLALKYGFPEIAKLLVESNAAIQLQDVEGNTVLHLALEYGFPEIAKLLIENNADIQAEDIDGNTTLHLALKHRFPEIAKLLIENNADIKSEDIDDNTALHLALKYGFPEIAELLIKNNVDIQIKNKEGSTALHLALGNGLPEIAKLLIENNVDIQVKNREGNTALHLAIQKHFTPIVKTIIHNSEDLLVKDKNGNNPLHLAVIYNYIDLVVLLINSNVKESLINDKNNAGKTPSRLSKELRQAEIYALLEGQHSYQTYLRTIPLWEAIIARDRGKVESAIKNGADSTYKNFEGKDAIDMLKEINYNTVSDFLINRISGISTPIIQVGTNDLILEVGFLDGDVFFARIEKGLIYWDMITKKEVSNYQHKRYYGMYYSSKKVEVKYDNGFNGYSGYYLFPNENLIEQWDIERRQLFRTFSSHTETVTAIKVIQKRGVFMSADKDNQIKYWDLKSGKELNNFKGKLDNIIFLGDEKTFLSWYENTIFLRDINTGKELKLFEGHSGFIKQVKYLPEIATFLSIDESNQVLCWNIETDRELIRFQGELSNIIFLEDKKTFLGWQENSIFLGDIDEGKKIKLLKGHSTLIKQVKYLPKTGTFFSVDKSNQILYWNIETGKELIRFQGELNDIIFLSDEKTFLSWHENSIFLRDSDTGKEIKLFKGHSTSIQQVKYLPEINTLLSIDEYYQALYWDIETGKELTRFQGEPSNIIFLEDKETFLSWYSDSIRYFNSHTGKLIYTIKNPSLYSIHKVILLNDNFFLCGDNSFTTHYRLKDGKEINTFKSSIHNVLPINKRQSFLSWNSNLTTHWDSNTGKMINNFVEDSGFIKEVNFLGGRTFMTVNHTSDNQENFIRYFNLETGKLVDTFYGTYYDIKFLEYDKKKFLVSDKNVIKLYDAITGEIISIFSGHTHKVKDISYSYDIGDTFWSIDENCIIKYWNIEKNKEIATFLNSNECNIYSIDNNQSTYYMKGVGSFSYVYKIDNYNAIQCWVFSNEIGQEVTPTYTFNNQASKITQFELLNGEAVFITKNADNVVRYWNMQNGITMRSFLDRVIESNTNQKNVEYGDLVLLDNQESFLIIANSNEIKQVDINSGKVIETVDVGFDKSLAQRIELLTDESAFIVFNSNELLLWDIKTGKLQRKLSGINYNYYNDDFGDSVFIRKEEIRITFTRTYAVSWVFNDKIDSIHYWNLKNGMNNTVSVPFYIKKIFTFKNSDIIMVLYTHHYDKEDRVVFINLATGNEPLSFNQYPQEINEKIWLTFSGNTIKYWDLDSLVNRRIGFSYTLETREVVTESIGFYGAEYFEGHSDEVRGILVVEENKTFLSFSNDKTIKYWSLVGRSEIRTFSGHAEGIRKILLSPDKKKILSISDKDVIKYWDLDTGSEIHTLKGRYGSIMELYFLPSGKNAISINEQNSFTIWNLEKGTENCTVISLLGNNKDFIITTPENYYMATKGAVNDLVHYVVGNKVYLFDQFDLQYNRPDKVLESIGLASKDLIETYKLAYIKRLKKSGISEERIPFFVNGEFDKDFNAPELSVKDKSYFSQTTKKTYTIGFFAQDAKYNLDRINVYVNGVPVFGRRGIDLSTQKVRSIQREISISLSSGSNVIEVSVLNEQGVESLKERFEVAYTPAQAALPTLYLISIGVSNYQDTNMNLGFARKDAEDVAQMLTQQQRRYGKIVIEKLLDADFNKSNMAQLKQKLLQTQVEDEVIIFYAGHGLLDSELDYYLATSQTNFSQPNDGKSILYDELEDLLDGIPARQKMLLVDACHSGEVDKDEYKILTENAEKGELKFRGFQSRGDDVRIGLQNSFELMRELFTDLRKGTGATVLSSAGGGEFAYEGKDWNNGVFTYCFLSGLKDKKADLNKDGKVMLSELQEYLGNAVSELTGGLQTPTSRIENITNDWRVW